GYAAADAGMGRDDQRGGALLPGLPVADDRARHVHCRYGAGHQPAGRRPAGRGRSPHSLDAHVYAVLLALVLHPFPPTRSSLPQPSFSTSRTSLRPAYLRSLIPSLSRPFARASPSLPPPFAPSSFPPFRPC